jgi:hypothetical protein
MNYSNFSYIKNNEIKSKQTPQNNCYIISQKDDNSARLKYYTTNHVDLLTAKDKLNAFAIDYRDTLFAPLAKDIDIDSNLTQSKLTRCKVKHGFGQLPLIIQQKHQLSHNNEKLSEEDKMRFLDYSNNMKKKTCIPRDSDFHNRFFYLFDDSKNIEKPDALKSVELPENMWQNLRCGRPTRFDKRPQ